MRGILEVDYVWRGILGLNEIELIFALAALTVLCFALVARRVLIIVCLELARTQNCCSVWRQRTEISPTDMYEKSNIWENLQKINTWKTPVWETAFLACHLLSWQARDLEELHRLSADQPTCLISIHSCDRPDTFTLDSSYRRINNFQQKIVPLENFPGSSTTHLEMFSIYQYVGHILICYLHSIISRYFKFLSLKKR